MKDLVIEKGDFVFHNGDFQITQKKDQIIAQCIGVYFMTNIGSYELNPDVGVDIEHLETLRTLPLVQLFVNHSLEWFLQNQYVHSVTVEKVLFQFSINQMNIWMKIAVPVSSEAQESTNSIETRLYITI